MSVEQFPESRIKRVPCNLPFDAPPTCSHGWDKPCAECAKVTAKVNELCSVDLGHGVTLDPTFARSAVEAIWSAGFKIEKV